MDSELYNEFVFNRDKLNTFDRRNGVSGMMRVRNDAEFIEKSIDSCISALDELIIVYHECTDNSPELIEKKRKEYPDKIKVYEYLPKIYSINLTKEEYEYAKSLPMDSIHLLANYYNYALSKTTYKYAMKIDADQIYFSDKLRYWCDAYRSELKINKTYTIGFLSLFLLKFINKLNFILKRIIKLPKFFIKLLFDHYLKFVYKLVVNEKIPISLSGINIFEYSNEIYVTVGKITKEVNILPPYNGVGDHLIFKVTNDTYYVPDDCFFYNTLRSDSFTYIENFVINKRYYHVGFFWFHMNQCRSNIKKKIESIYIKNPELFYEINHFVNESYYKIDKMTDNQVIKLYQKSIFQILHIADVKNIIKYNK